MLAEVEHPQQRSAFAAHRLSKCCSVSRLVFFFSPSPVHRSGAGGKQLRLSVLYDVSLMAERNSGEEKGQMYLLPWRTSLLLASSTIKVQLPFGVLNTGTAYHQHTQGGEKYNVLIKKHSHFQVVVQFLQFHQQSGKRKIFSNDCNRHVLFCHTCLSDTFKLHNLGPCTDSKLALYKTAFTGEARWANELLFCMTK